MSVVLPLLKNVVASLAKSVLLPFGLIAAALATDAAIQKKSYGSGTTTLVYSNEDLNDIMEIVKSLEESGSLIKGVSKTIKMKQKNKRVDFLVCY